MAQACIPSLWQPRQEDHECKVILGYIAKSCLKTQIHKQEGSNRNKEYKWTSELCLRSWDYLTAAGKSSEDFIRALDTKDS